MTATALGPAANSGVGSLCIEAPLAEYRRLIVWVTTWPDSTWAIESVWDDIADSREVAENLKGPCGADSRSSRVDADRAVGCSARAREPQAAFATGGSGAVPTSNLPIRIGTERGVVAWSS